MASSDAGRPSKNPHPTIVQLEKTEKLKDVLRSEADNCLPCKLVGAAAMFGMATYIFISGRRSLMSRAPEIARKSRTPIEYRLMGLGTLSGAFVAMGFYRLIN